MQNMCGSFIVGIFWPHNPVMQTESNKKNVNVWQDAKMVVKCLLIELFPLVVTFYRNNNKTYQGDFVA